MAGRRGTLRRGAPIAAAFLAAMPAYALVTAGFEALAKVEQGRWQIRDLDAGVDRDAICIGDPLVLAQVEHRGAACARELAESSGREGVVQYTCPGRGFGRSTFKVETPRLVRIDTQGLNGSRPFAYRLEARRLGPC